MNKTINELDIPEGALILLIQREGKSIIPKGNTKILKDDTIVISAKDKIHHV